MTLDKAPPQTVTLAADQLDQLATQIAAELAPRITTHLAAHAAGASPLVDAATLATLLDVDRSYVYTHAARLGVQRLPGDGPRRRLRFDPDVARAALATADPAPTATPHRRSRRRPHTTATGAPLLPIKETTRHAA